MEVGGVRLLCYKVLLWWIKKKNSRKKSQIVNKNHIGLTYKCISYYFY